MKFILIMLLIGSRDDYAITQEFNNKEACMSASNLIIQKYDSNQKNNYRTTYSRPQTFCVEKGKE